MDIGHRWYELFLAENQFDFKVTDATEFGLGWVAAFCTFCCSMWWDFKCNCRWEKFQAEAEKTLCASAKNALVAKKCTYGQKLAANLAPPHLSVQWPHCCTKNRNHFWCDKNLHKKPWISLEKTIQVLLHHLHLSLPPVSFQRALTTLAHNAHKLHCSGPDQNVKFILQ